MPLRVTDFDEKFLFTKTDPENIISAKEGAWFFRTETNFYLNADGDGDGDSIDSWRQLPYKTVILPAPNPNHVIQFEFPTELWIKTTDGYFDEFRQRLPKTGWKFYSYDDVFFGAQPRNLNWKFPVPTNSNDPVGNNNSRSYDENFFYAKTGGVWYRTPIAIFSFPTSDIGEQNSLYTSLPFVVAPRHLPIPPSSSIVNTVVVGDQTYDKEFFYIRVSKWKRTPLIYFNPSKMAIF